MVYVKKAYVKFGKCQTIESFNDLVYNKTSEDYIDKPIIFKKILSSRELTLIIFSKDMRNVI